MTTTSAFDFRTGDVVIVATSAGDAGDERTVRSVASDDAGDGFGPTVVLDRPFDGFRSWFAADLRLRRRGGAQ